MARVLSSSRATLRRAAFASTCRAPSVASSSCRGTVAPHVIPVKHEIGDFEMLLSAVRAGLGLAQLPLWMVAEDIQRGKLITVLDGMSGGELPVNLLWPRTPTLPARIRVVVDELLRIAP